MRTAPAAAVSSLLFSKWEHRAPVFADQQNRFDQLPPSLAMQGFQPATPYPGWDNNWDYCDLDQKAIAKRLSHEWPISDYPMAIHKLYAEHSDRSSEKVDKTIEANKDDLPGLYKRAFLQHAYGGASTRHIILVRHGQYEEQKALSKKLHSENPHHFGLPGDTKERELDDARILTELGRHQAAKVGDRLAELLRPALTTTGRETHVRLHVSTLTRARETADIIASRLPDHVRRIEPNPLFVEGVPPAHTIPYMARGGEEYLWGRARDLHIEGAKMEAAFRSLFYRDLPCKPPKQKEENQCENDVEITARQAKSKVPRQEYEIVVCHQNLIRYFTLRALQLPPEAWLRLGGHNGSFTHLKIRPSGNVSLVCFGDSGHMALDEITFGMTKGLET